MKTTRVRKNLLRLDKIELQALNDGFEALVAIEGNGGYQHVAGIYGKPGIPYRPTQTQLFLPWHRAYLMAFEQMLAHAWPGVALPYWDWAQPETLSKGLPSRLKSVAYSDKDQGIWLNALCRSPIDCIGHQTYTERNPGKPAAIEPAIQKLRKCGSQAEFEDLSAELEAASREFRAWVGGHMNDDDYAAYDPLFWFHHANLDRIWADWQKTHPNALPESLREVTLEPFGVKVGAMETLDRLGYLYRDQEPEEKLLERA
jgi:tyrosinase